MVDVDDIIALFQIEKRGNSHPVAEFTFASGELILDAPKDFGVGENNQAGVGQTETGLQNAVDKRYAPAALCIHENLNWCLGDASILQQPSDTRRLRGNHNDTRLVFNVSRDGIGERSRLSRETL